MRPAINAQINQANIVMVQPFAMFIYSTPCVSVYASEVLVSVSVFDAIVAMKGGLVLPVVGGTVCIGGGGGAYTATRMTFFEEVR